MLYLIRPDGSMGWSSLPAEWVLERPERPMVDLSKIDWDDTGRPTAIVILRLALRYGVACCLGIVIDGEHVYAGDEHVSIQEAVDRIEKRLARPAIPALLEHWTSLGGDLPDPV